MVVDFSSKTPPELYPAVYLRNPSTLIYELKDLIKKTYFEQSLVAKINDCEEKFNTKWLKFSDVFNGIK